jgi:hypothetical protein
MVEKGIKLHALIGNHDIFWKHSLAVNSPDLLLKGYDNITLYDKPTKITLGGADIDMIPWICDENMEEVQRFIRASVSPTCIGHFELSGFQLMKGVQAFEGTSADFLDRYDAVFSGHYHTQSESGNVRYLGVPYEMFWSDYKDPKGFFVFDTETYSMEFVPNPHIIFHKIFYDDTQPDFNVDAEMYKDCYVKVVVLNRKNPHTFDKMIDALYEVGLVDLTIVEDHAEILDESALPEVLDQAEDTLTILSSYITQQQVDVDVNRLNALMRELYMDAMSRETLT